MIGIGQQILGWHEAIPHADSNLKAEYLDYQGNKPDWVYMMQDSSQLVINIG